MIIHSTTLTNIPLRLEMQLKDSFLLNSGEVHIWSACLSENENEISYFTSLLSQDEKEKANQFRLSEDQKRYTISRGILRCLLGNYLRETPEEIEFLYGLWGKPCLQKEKNIFFNLSHSKDYALYAFAQGYEVGIDIEFINRNLELEEMARGIFSAEEFSFWNVLSSEEKRESFFKCWASKEAFLKSIGKGWLETKQTPTLFEANTRASNNSKLKQNRKLLEDGMVTYPYCFEDIPNYASALFVEGPPVRPLYFSWNSNN